MDFPSKSPVPWSVCVCICVHVCVCVWGLPAPGSGVSNKVLRGPLLVQILNTLGTLFGRSRARGPNRLRDTLHRHSMGHPNLWGCSSGHSADISGRKGRREWCRGPAISQPLSFPKTPDFLLIAANLAIMSLQQVSSNDAFEPLLNDRRSLRIFGH